MMIAKSPLVSVCMPAFNAEKHVQAAVDSALDQTHPNVEVICVNDGSTDGTLDLLEGYGDRIKVISVANGGAQRARNLALDQSRGAYVQFLDADNYLSPSALERKLRAFKTHEADLVFSNMEVLHDDGSVQSLGPRAAVNGLDPFLYCLRHNCPGGRTSIDTNAGLHRAEALKRVGGFRCGVATGQDKDLAFRLAAAGARLYYLDEVLTVYRDHSGPRITHSQRDPCYPLEYFVDLSALLRREGVYLLSEERRTALAEKLLELSRHAFRSGYRAVAEMGFDAAGSLQADPSGYGSLPYRVLARALGPFRTESIRQKLSRKP